MARANFYILAKPLQSHLELKERVAAGQPSFTWSKTKVELEACPWKLCLGWHYPIG
jgi:hypothetical protein